MTKKHDWSDVSTLEQEYEQETGNNPIYVHTDGNKFNSDLYVEWLILRIKTLETAANVAIAISGDY